MNNLFYCVITILITCIVPSCTSDYSQNLGQKYVYRDEGGRIKEVFSQESDGEQIPATVISFDYNRQFIIAKQKPKIPQDPLYEKEYLYPLGVDTVYYWIIIKKEHIVLGPMSLDAFNDAKVKYHVPNDLKLD